MDTEPKNPANEIVKVALPPIRLAPLAEIRAYQITEDELNRLAEGSPSSLCLNFGLFFSSSFLSFLATLLTTTIQDPNTFVVFVVLCSVSGVASLVLLSFWRWFQSRQGSLINSIRRRMPAEAIQLSPGNVVEEA